jgi:nucleoside-diphosphate-sugar epimerase
VHLLFVGPDEENLTGTTKLATAATKKIQRWIQVSTVGVYDTNIHSHVTEHSSINPINVYQKTKLQADELLLKACQKDNLQVIIVRPGNVFGMAMRNESFFNLVKSIRNKHFFYIGDGNSLLNYVDIENVISALMLCAKSKYVNNEIFIVSDSISLCEFVDIIKKIYGLDYKTYTLPSSLSYALAYVCKPIMAFPLKISRINALTNKVQYSCDKIRKNLGYKEIITVNESVMNLCKERMLVEK